MRSIVIGCAMGLLFVPFVGCIAIKVHDGAASTELVAKKQVPDKCHKIWPKITGDSHGNVNVEFMAEVDFKIIEEHKVSYGDDEYLSFGCFPGALSCRGEYRDCVINAAGIFYYNLVFAGLPTVYGLLVEPFVPHYPDQTDSIVSQTAFRQSALIGFSRYAKVQPLKAVNQESASSKGVDVTLEDIVVRSAVFNGGVQHGKCFKISLDKLPVNLKIEFPDVHPYKEAIQGYKGELEFDIN